MVIRILLAVLFGIGAIIGLCVMIYGFCEDERTPKVVGSITCIVLVLAFVLVPWCFNTIESGEIAVVKTLGRVTDTAEPGMYSYFWMTTNYVKLDTKVRQVDIVTSSYSNDKQTMDIQMTVQYQIKKDMAKEIVIHYGSLEMLEARIQSVAIERTKAIMSSYTADSLIEQRNVISTAVAETVEAALGENYYIDITNIALTNIDFSDAYEQAVEQKMIATQEVERAKAEAQKAEETAKGQLKVAEQQALAKIEAAKADAEAKRLAAEAEANAIAIKSLEVARMLGLTTIVDGVEVIKPDLTMEEAQLIADYLKYVEYITNWDGKLPNTYVGSDSNMGIILPNP